MPEEADPRAWKLNLCTKTHPLTPLEHNFMVHSSHLNKGQVTVPWVRCNKTWMDKLQVILNVREGTY